MWIAIGIVIAFAAFSALWMVAERTWDKGQFRESGAEGFVANIRARKAIQLLEEKPEVQPLDVRTSKKFRKEHLPGAIHAPLDSLGEIDAEQIQSLEKNRPLLVYCDGGYRSRKAIQSLKKLGFTSIYHLHRGILSWKLKGGSCDNGEASA